MTSQIEGQHAVPRRHSRFLPWLANATIVFPLFTIGGVYCEWLQAWYMLGHQPEWSTNDPTDIPGSRRLHILTTIMVLGDLPFFVAAIASNAVYIAERRPSISRAFVRLTCLVSFWFGTYSFACLDPYGIINWWLD